MFVNKNYKRESLIWKIWNQSLCCISVVKISTTDICSKETNNNKKNHNERKNLQSLLKNALVNISGPNPGDAKGEHEHAAESAAMSFHSQPLMSPETLDPAKGNRNCRQMKAKNEFRVEKKEWRRTESEKKLTARVPFHEGYRRSQRLYWKVFHVEDFDWRDDSMSRLWLVESTQIF